MASIVYVFVLNGIAFFLYGLDKWKAKTKQWRIPEKTLLFISLCGGSIGSILGMYVFHHKTRKWYFWLIHGFSFILLLLIVYKK